MAQASASVVQNTTPTIVDESALYGKIYEVRGRKVMLDFELAEIYGYSTTAFNQQVKRNIEKFDEDFMFQLTKNELENLMSQIVTSSWGGIRKLPYAFTEQGVYMLMTVLRGELATRQSKALIRLFKRMKDHIIENQGIIGQREFIMLSMRVTDNLREIMDMRASLDEADAKMARIYEQLAQAVTRSELSAMMLDFGDPAVRRDYLLLNSHPIEAAEAYAEVYGSARANVMLVDNYIGSKTLVLLKNVPRGVPIKVYSDNKGRKLHSRELADFQREYPDVDVQLYAAGGIFHDRYIAIDFGCDGERIFHCGASSKDAGEYVSTIAELEHPETYRELFERLFEQPMLKLP